MSHTCVTHRDHTEMERFSDFPKLAVLSSFLQLVGNKVLKTCLQVGYKVGPFVTDLVSRGTL